MTLCVERQQHHLRSGAYLGALLDAAHNLTRLPIVEHDGIVGAHAQQRTAENGSSTERRAERSVLLQAPTPSHARDTREIGYTTSPNVRTLKFLKTLILEDDSRIA